MSPLLLVPVAGLGLYYFLRKKPGFVPQPVTATAVSPARAAATVAPAGSPQAAADQAIVDAAFDALPHAQAADFRQAPISALGPEEIHEVAGTETETDLQAFVPTLADVAQNPFGTLGSILGSPSSSNGGSGPQDDNLSFDPGSGLNKDRGLGGSVEEEAGFFDSFNPFGDD